MNGMMIGIFLFSLVMAQNDTIEDNSDELELGSIVRTFRFYDTLLEQTVANHVIQNSPLFWRGRWFFWDPTIAITRPNEHICMHELDKTYRDIGLVRFSNGTRPASIGVLCETHQECCGIDCCDATTNIFIRIARWIILVIAVWMVLTMIVESFRQCFNCIFATRIRKYQKKRNNERLRKSFESELVNASRAVTPMITRHNREFERKVSRSRSELNDLYPNIPRITEIRY